MAERINGVMRLEAKDTVNIHVAYYCKRLGHGSVKSSDQNPKN